MNSAPCWQYGHGLIALHRDPDNALPYLRQALSTASKPGNVWPDYQSAICCRLAEALQERRELDEAEKYFREEWQRHPEANPRAALGLTGQLAQERGDDQNAVDFFEKARQHPSARKIATVQLAILALARKDEAAAAAYDKEAAALPPDEAWPDPLRDEVMRLSVGQRAFEREVSQLEKNGQFEAAVELYRGQLHKKPTVQVYTGLGINLCRLKQYDEAEKCLADEGLRLESGEFLDTLRGFALVQFNRASKGMAAFAGFAICQKMVRRDSQTRPASYGTET